MLAALLEKGLGEAIVVAGGIIPERDRPALLEMGVAAVFGPGARTDEIVAFIERTARERRQRAAAKR